MPDDFALLGGRRQNHRLYDECGHFMVFADATFGSDLPGCHLLPGLVPLLGPCFG
jgi:hypothetical protein